jgi:UDP-N-acetylmuramoyl-tripeptide--D-alanyl-D-alanine ligase
MFRTTFIAVTGSVGKTTAVECLKQALATRFAVNGAQHGKNLIHDVYLLLLRTRRRHRFAVVELGTMKPGDLKHTGWVTAPDTAVVLTVAAVHTDRFAGLEAIAFEKSHLAASVGRRGLAVLNGDDPRVAAMAARCRGKVVTFGRSLRCDVWAGEVSSVWPARLSFRVHRGAESHMVQTQLVGEHWLNSVLAALTTAVCHGVELAPAAAAMARVEPSRCRMQPVPLPSGAIAFRDDYNTSFAGLPAALRALEQAQGRRILVFRDVYDTGLANMERFRMVGRIVARSADLTLLYGNVRMRMRSAMAQAGVPRESILVFRDIWEVADYLKANLRAGDVALLRNAYSDGAERIYFAQLGSVGCRTPNCDRAMACDFCAELRPGLENASGLPAPTRPYWLPIRF